MVLMIPLLNDNGTVQKPNIIKFTKEERSSDTILFRNRIEMKYKEPRRMRNTML